MKRTKMKEYEETNWKQPADLTSAVQGAWWHTRCLREIYWQLVLTRPVLHSSNRKHVSQVKMTPCQYSKNPFPPKSSVYICFSSENQWVGHGLGRLSLEIVSKRLGQGTRNFPSSTARPPGAKMESPPETAVPYPNNRRKSKEKKWPKTSKDLKTHLKYLKSCSQDLENCPNMI